MNRFGNRFVVSIFGESHSELMGITIDGVSAGLELCLEDFECDLARRASGAKGTTLRHENDKPKIVSGLFNGRTTGAPLTILIENNNTISKDYSNITKQPRPSHADLTAKARFGGYNDYRGGGQFSGRLTAMIVAGGVVAKKLLKLQGIDIEAYIKHIHGKTTSQDIQNVIDTAMKNGDSVGGVIECKINGLKIGYGEPYFDSIESTISHIVFAIPAIKGIEFGKGFDSGLEFGSLHNDTIINNSGKTSQNNSGGINGGISNGNDIIFRVAVKPTPSISLPQQTLNIENNKIETLEIKGRHDCCIALRVAPVLEAAAAIALCNIIDLPKFITKQ